MRNEESQGPAEPEPPRREFRFKPTEFEVTNRPVEETPSTASIDVKKILRAANAAPPPVPGIIAPSQEDNDVHALLRANVAEDDAAGRNDVSLKPRKMSNRMRDYWVMLVGGNAMVAGIVLFLGINAMTTAFGFVAMGVLTGVTSWIMLYVMDDY